MSYLVDGAVFVLKTADSFAYAIEGISEILLVMLLKVIGFEFVALVAGKVIGIGALDVLGAGALTVLLACAAPPDKPRNNPVITTLAKSFLMRKS